MSILNLIKQKIAKLQNKEPTEPTPELISQYKDNNSSVELYLQDQKLIYKIKDNNNDISLSLKYYPQDYNQNTLAGHQLDIYFNGYELYNFAYLGSEREKSPNEIPPFLTRTEFSYLMNKLQDYSFFPLLKNHLFYGKSQEDMQKQEQAIQANLQKTEIKNKKAAFNRDTLISEHRDNNGRVALSVENQTLYYDIQDKSNNIYTLSLKHYDYAYHPSEPTEIFTGHRIEFLVNGKKAFTKDAYLGKHRLQSDTIFLSKPELNKLLDIMKENPNYPLLKTYLFYGKKWENAHGIKNNAINKIINKNSYSR